MIVLGEDGGRGGRRGGGEGGEEGGGEEEKKEQSQGGHWLSSHEVTEMDRSLCIYPKCWALDTQLRTLSCHPSG